MDCELAQDNRRVLVIDDNEAIHQDFLKILEPRPDDVALGMQESLLFGDAIEAPSSRRRFEVTTAASGVAGLEFVEESLRQQQPFAVAFVDMRMPGGWDTANAH